MGQRPCYTNKNTTQTLREGLEEHYALNCRITLPETMPPELAKILQSHDVAHVIYGCDTGIYDELKLLLLSSLTSECSNDCFSVMRKTPAVEVIYGDVIREKGVLWLGLRVLKVIPSFIPELISIYFKTRLRNKRVPLLEFPSWLERSVNDIRQEFDLLELLK